MNLLDLAIAAAVVLSLIGGYRRGFWVSLAQFAGTLAGLLLGARFAPDLIDRLGVTDALARQLLTLLVLFLACGIGGSLGAALIAPLRRLLLGNRLLGAFDSLLGAALSAAITLAIVWLLALSFARGPLPVLAQAIQQSAIIRRVDASVPLPPAFVARLQQILAGTFLPPVFAGLEPDLPSSSTVSPESAGTAGVRAAAASTVRVEGLGCGGVATGSGFAVGDGLIVTNAHVVSGTTGTRVSTAQGRSAAATVVYVDPEQDLAVLRSSGLDLAPLGLADAALGTRGAVIGYPGGGPLRIDAAVVERPLTSRGRDIYNRRLVTREIVVVTARVRPGNSGGPLVDESGRVLGAIFAGSVSNPGQAYAIPADEVRAAIDRAVGERASVDTRRLPCVR